MKRSYTVLLRAEPEGGFGVLVPALPGCVSYGDTIPEALDMAEKAIRCHTNGLRDVGEPVPEEGCEVTIHTDDLIGTLFAYRLSVAETVPEVTKVA